MRARRGTIERPRKVDYNSGRDQMSLKPKRNRSYLCGVGVTSRKPFDVPRVGKEAHRDRRVWPDRFATSKLEYFSPRTQT